jgi:non-ribosomal peptide synthetase component F
MQGGSVPLAIPADVVAALDDLAQRNQTSLFMVVHALVATLLARLSNSDDITVGTPVGGRDHADLEPLVGMFVNTVVLRTHIDSGDRFDDLLSRVRTGDLDAFANDDIPFENVVGALVPKRQSSHSPLFQVLLSFENNETARVELPGLSVGVVADMATGAKFDLTFTLDDKIDKTGERTLTGRITYASDVFDQNTVATIGQRLVILAHAVAEDPTIVIGDVDILTDDERMETAPAPVSAPEPARYTARDLAALLAAAVDIDPDAIAVDHDGARITYREFNERFSQLSGPLTERGMDSDAIASVVLSGLVPTIMLAPEGFATVLDTVIDDAARLVGGRSLDRYRTTPAEPAGQATGMSGFASIRVRRQSAVRKHP